MQIRINRDHVKTAANGAIAFVVDFKAAKATKHRMTADGKREDDDFVVYAASSVAGTAAAGAVNKATNRHVDRIIDRVADWHQSRKTDPPKTEKL